MGINGNLIYTYGHNVAMFWNVRDVLNPDRDYFPHIICRPPHHYVFLAANNEVKIFMVEPPSESRPAILVYDNVGMKMGEISNVAALLLDGDALYVVQRVTDGLGMDKDLIELKMLHLDDNGGSVNLTPVCDLPLERFDIPDSIDVWNPKMCNVAICGRRFTLHTLGPLYREPFVLIYDTANKSTILRKEVPTTRELSSFVVTFITSIIF